jgi:hypothetical protein
MLPASLTREHGRKGVFGFAASHAACLIVFLYRFKPAPSYGFFLCF